MKLKAKSGFYSNDCQRFMKFYFKKLLGGPITHIHLNKRNVISKLTVALKAHFNIKAMRE